MDNFEEKKLLEKLFGFSSYCVFFIGWGGQDGQTTRKQFFSYVSEARIFGKHALGNQGKSSEHVGNSLLDRFGRVYIF